jgi:hypothetical protein
MPKRRKLFSVKNNDKNIDMNVDEALYKHFQSLTPLEVVYKCWGTTLKLFFRRWLQKFQHHTPTFVNKDR